MGILEIKNRTENWKTAQAFAPFFGEGDEAGRRRVALANKLLANAGYAELPVSEGVALELFWKGVRDWVHANKRVEGNFTERYSRLFGDLREKVSAFGQFQDLEEKNYRADNKGENLYNNLRNTEIDIVLTSKDYLFIGEAKDESGLGANSELVLVHQLIRQHVTARVLLDLIGAKKTVIQFVVGKNMESLRNTGQVKFMIEQHWLSEDNVLSWECVKNLAKS